MEWIYYALGGLLCITLIPWTVNAIIKKGSVVISAPSTGNENIIADQVYYLPTAQLQVRATARVVLTKDSSGAIIDASLNDLVFSTTVQTIPDNRYPIALKYCPNIFSNDDLTFSISAEGLVEGINITAEDRIAAIIGQITDAPKETLSAIRQVGAQTEIPGMTATITTETKEYTNDFLVLNEEIRARQADRRWVIPIDGTANKATAVTASFTLKFPAGALGELKATDKNFDGILTRPFKTIIMEIFRNDNGTGTPDAKYQVRIPDENRLICVPVSRGAFIKKVYGMKMVNGNLSENVINKPSQVEGFVAIPIKIAKAIATIPSHLLQFRIETTNRSTTLETSRQNLAKVQLQNKKDLITREAELIKSEAEAQRTRITAESDILKGKLEAEKTLIDAQKNIITANKELETAKKDWETAKTELQELLKKIDEAKKQP